MDFNFNLKATSVYRSLKVSSFSLFKYSRMLSELFLYLFVFSWILVFLYFLGYFADPLAFKLPVFLLLLLVFFFEMHLFSEFWVKKPKVSGSVLESLAKPEAYNLAEFLNIKSCNAIDDAIKLCRVRNFPEVTS